MSICHTSTAASHWVRSALYFTAPFSPVLRLTRMDHNVTPTIHRRQLSQLFTALGDVPIADSVHGALPNEKISFDIYTAPNKPEGVVKTNWMKTVPEKGFFPYIRFYELGTSSTTRSGDPMTLSRLDSCKRYQDWQSWMTLASQKNRCLTAYGYLPVHRWTKSWLVVINH